MREWYITNEYGKTINFNKDSDFRITRITGLSHNGVKFSTSQASGQTGETINSIKVQSKNVTIEGDFKDIYSNKRDFLDTLIPGMPVTFRVMDLSEKYDVYINAYVSTSPNISEDDRVYKQFQLVLYCNYPYWRDVNTSVVDFVSYVSGFRLPRSFSNTIPWKIAEKQINNLSYAVNKGSDKTGFKVRFEATGYVKAPELLKVVTQEHIRLIDLEMQEGDIVEVSTYENNKYVKRYRNGAEENVFYTMDDDSNFFQLDIGSNPLRFDAAQASVNNLFCSMIFENTYVGI